MMMKSFTYKLFPIFFFFTTVAHSQISDDFSDGDFSALPEWMGTVSHFTVNQYKELQLQAPEAGTSYLIINDSFIGEIIEWHFKVHLNFSPSDNNFARIYLMTDNHSLLLPQTNGFYLQLGENSNRDAIELFYRHEGIVESVCRSADGLIANAFQYNIKVIKDENNNWKIYVDSTLSNYFECCAEGTKNGVYGQAVMGIWCQYTVSNQNKFYFDDFYVGSIPIDTVKPEIRSIHCQEDTNSIILVFSENVSEETILNCSNFEVVASGISPAISSWVDHNRKTVQLFFPNSFQNNIPEQLRVKNIEDLAGNKMQDTVMNFVFYKIERHDVVISEIMADPSPPIQLPPIEYIELHNRLNFKIRLSGWTVKLGNSVKSLSDLELEAKGYAVLIPVMSMNDFAEIGSCFYPVSSLGITDAGQQIVLSNQNKEIIHTVNFKQNWHRNKIKQEGGWALEMIDDGNPCGESNNWDSSVSHTGGTPGQTNSITKENQDVIVPEIERVTQLDSNAIQLFFTETVMMNCDHHTTLFKIDRNLQIDTVKEVPPNYRSCVITFTEKLRENTIYTLSVLDTICDCVGNLVRKWSSICFGVSRSPVYGDLVINEILTNPPHSEDADFIEIYNKSDKIIDLKEVKIGAGGDQFPDRAVIAQPQGYQLFPKMYAVLCKNPMLTRASYFSLNPEKLLLCDSLPAYANGSGIVHLTDLALSTIDKLIYDESMHYAMLNTLDGVSLERIRFVCKTQDPNHWKSAAASVGFATPGYQNSQYIGEIIKDEQLTLHPEVFSPNNDGFDDFVEIYCKFYETENRITLTVFDRFGNLVKIVANNQLCGIEEHFIWDGINDNGMLTSPNLYIVKLQYWNLTGKKKTIKKVIGITN
ncbi:MAG: lamin tail domain-containing protein [Bacteroidales bacterium]